MQFAKRKWFWMMIHAGNVDLFKWDLEMGMSRLKPPSSASLISRYILRLGQRGRCCFFAACPNRKMYLETREADEGIFIHPKQINHAKSEIEKWAMQTKPSYFLKRCISKFKQFHRISTKSEIVYHKSSTLKDISFLHLGQVKRYTLLIVTWIIDKGIIYLLCKFFFWLLEMILFFLVQSLSVILCIFLEYSSFFLILFSANFCSKYFKRSLMNGAAIF